ncbi:cytochrome P450 [Mycobacterium avium subsp. hominissuis]|uniref:cytochrome P450 n=1 Tax=Mycobacterium avium TaxID=1764 RepID=UPI0003D1E320|nr:cytochrome P450 [Mycobacterium avium]ETA95543.1 cytochrome P450 [Mycobacterium avium 10-5581]APA74587.1 cytochrome P450 [Mycobacterium avium subsp. hominissuis]ATO61553.1 cytochrome P450 [Mycobacterium avium subsp. hominissuis]ATO66104.1 cytochrome P450 [Mycobacterium avium subsp. hominissuis]ATO70690.1 cytochrome P450 [Mycobacterium avium subsp. hominissuis]
MTDFDSVDFFTDQSLVPDPQPFYDHLRRQCAIVREPHHGVMVVTAYREAAAILKDEDAFSACVAVGGPFPPLPFEPRGDDIGALIEQHRSELPMNEHIATMDPPEHTRVRSLLSRLFTPHRIKQHEEAVRQLADQQLDTFIANGRCDFLSEYAKPFATLMIAGLLGLREEDPESSAAMSAKAETGTTVGALDREVIAADPQKWLNETLAALIEDRRREPRQDMLTDLATAKYPDGTTPDVIDVVRPATFLLAAGVETVGKSLTAALQILAERPELQQKLRADNDLIPAFVEESLRMEGPVKTVFRLARKTTKVGGVDIPAGTVVMVCLGAVNRDPARFDDPHSFRLDRNNVRDHVTFSRGGHACPGASLARLEGGVSIARILDRMRDITIDEAKHGPAENRTYTYEPTFMLRGVTELHITFTPVA